MAIIYESEKRNHYLSILYFLISVVLDCIASIFLVVMHSLNLLLIVPCLLSLTAFVLSLGGPDYAHKAPYSKLNSFLMHAYPAMSVISLSIIVLFLVGIFGYINDKIK